MEEITKGLSNIIVWQDDILVYASDRESLAVTVNSLLIILNKKNVKINWDKSVRCVDEVTFLGHVINEKGIGPDPDLVSVIMSMQPPSSLKELERFISMINFYCTKIPQFAEKCIPLNKLRRKGVVFAWTAEQQDAFECLRNAFCSRRLVQPYSLQKEATLTCDASENSIGGVISQNGLPVMFMSRTLLPAEKNYANIEREALSIMWCVKRAEKLLLGRHFTIVEYVLIINHWSLFLAKGKAYLKLLLPGCNVGQLF